MPKKLQQEVTFVLQNLHWKTLGLPAWFCDRSGGMDCPDFNFCWQGDVMVQTSRFALNIIELHILHIGLWNSPLLKRLLGGGGRCLIWPPAFAAFCVLRMGLYRAEAPVATLQSIDWHDTRTEGSLCRMAAPLSVGFCTLGGQKIHLTVWWCMVYHIASLIIDENHVF